MKKLFYAFTLSTLTILGCTNKVQTNTFSSDIYLLQKLNDITVLKNGEAMIAVSGNCQGRVLASTMDGENGTNMTWFNSDLVKTEENILHNFSSLGGGARFWFGPEVGKHGIFFDPGTPQEVPYIKISPELNNRNFKLIDQSPLSATYASDMNIRNAGGYVFNLNVKRTLSLLNKETIEKELNIKLNEKINQVSYSSQTWMKNIGAEKWSTETGLLSIWEIGCMKSSNNCTVIIPCSTKPDSISNYFTPLDDSRLIIKDSVVFYKSDAKYLNKIGIQPNLCKDVFGFYSPEKELLSIVKFHFTNDSLYANSQWGNTEQYKGDVINIFNGEVVPELDHNWPFFEVESSSSVKELEPNEEIYHKQSIFLFKGSFEELDKISDRTLGISLKQIPKFQ